MRGAIGFLSSFFLELFLFLGCAVARTSRREESRRFDIASVIPFLFFLAILPSRQRSRILSSRFPFYRLSFGIGLDSGKQLASASPLALSPLVAS